MTKVRHGVAALLLVAAASGATQAWAEDVQGVWTRDDGAIKVEFSPCGGAVCGSVSWLKSAAGAAKVGQRVFFDMVRSDQITWTGKAFNPEDGRTYSGKMVLSGKKLKTSGCVMGGLICKTVVWLR
ncbi:Uncharacterized conserved protein, DUF2147 family [Rhodoblastus acidophilus]|uniref:Uncharacterized conserved protein, DUF2147 family n=1 Tax=Rhodoblastus acidophilus TaxID=1074 RepID=A0A212RL48_RHOAC|nr:DUF2147 domain-containing protein [Rhodoblastus acidophilus]SNB73043.1 Uncharacterized conserved protein, DUF2147 family [Rhodoblastus acidophilus]